MSEQRKLPNNIRQIGERDQQPRIYLEDYVETFIHKCKEEDRTQVGILLGKSETIDEMICYFVDGAIVLDELLDGEGLIQFTPEVWSIIDKQAAEYFPNSEVCGWFIHSVESYNSDLVRLKQIHRSVFHEGNSLMLISSGEENIFYSSGEEGMDVVRGYYIYYERNECMQNYMVLIASQKKKIDMVDSAVHSFRLLTAENREKKQKRIYSKHTLQQIGAGTAVAAAFLGICVSMHYAGISFNSSSQHMAVGDTREAQEQVNATVEEKSGEDLNEGLSSNILSEIGKNTTEIKETTENTEEELESISIANMGENVDSNQANENMESVQEADAALVGSGSYIVLPGDTLIQISINFYGSVERIEDICRYNGIENPNEIYVGQKLIMP
ncbi:MAG: LysM peptidoglycan-binding domain-containing protein [Lachnospiraceae bacterium]